MVCLLILLILTCTDLSELCVLIYYVCHGNLVVLSSYILGPWLLISLWNKQTP